MTNSNSGNGIFDFLQRNPPPSYHAVSSRGSRHEAHGTHPHLTHEHPPHSLYHSQHSQNQFSRSSTDSVQGNYAAHHGISSYDYSRQYPGQSMADPPTPYMPRYPDPRSQHYRRESQDTMSSSEDAGAYANTPGSSSLKYECDYCGKGFNRPSSLKVCIFNISRSPRLVLKTTARPQDTPKQPYGRKT